MIKSVNVKLDEDRLIARSFVVKGKEGNGLVLVSYNLFGTTNALIDFLLR